jgi:hypothetical protein
MHRINLVTTHLAKTQAHNALKHCGFEEVATPGKDGTEWRFRFPEKVCN